jgi:hypothetical protein
MLRASASSIVGTLGTNWRNPSELQPVSFRRSEPFRRRNLGERGGFFKPCARYPYTYRMNLGKVIAGVATTPVRVGVAAADTGLGVAAIALGLVKRSLGEEGAQTADPLTDILPLRGAIVGANRVAELTEDDRAMGRALARGGPADQLMRPGGVVDLLTAPGGLLNRVSVEGSALERALAPGGLADRLLGEDGPIERMFAEDGLIERMFAEDGLVDKLTAKNGPLEQLTEAAEILSRLAPAVETLTPTADTLQDAVDALNRVVNSLSGITDRIPRRRSRRATQPTVPSMRIEDHDALDVVDE